MSIETTGREKSGRLLLVDDEQGVLQALKRLFYRHYDVVLANGGEEALSILETDSFDMIISDIRVLLTGYSDLDSAIKAVNEGNIYRYISKPWDNDQLRDMVAEALESKELKSANQRLSAHIVEQNDELARLNREAKLQDAYKTLRHEFDAMVHILVGSMEDRLGMEKGSTERFAELVRSFAKNSGLDEAQINDTYYAALLKNLGKMSLSDSVLNKAIPQMSNAEKQEYARFTINGQTSLMLLEPLQNAANIIRSHMELYNGKGFPDRLAGDAIPKPSRILRIVCDYAELQRESNFLGEPLSEKDARVYLLKLAGQRYDRELVDIFAETLETYDGGAISSMERLNIADVKEGMILAGNLVSPGGAVLLSTGTQLTERHVAKLQALMRQFEGHEIFVHVRKPPQDEE